jgi:hypothetical protein
MKDSYGQICEIYRLSSGDITMGVVNSGPYMESKVIEDNWMCLSKDAFSQVLDRIEEIMGVDWRMEEEEELE